MTEFTERQHVDAIKRSLKETGRRMAKKYKARHPTSQRRARREKGQRPRPRSAIRRCRARADVS